MTVPSMTPTEITVLYDEGCPFCRRCRAWLDEEPQEVPIHFLASGSPRAHDICHGQVPELGDDLVVLAADGRVWAGPEAFVMCLWALRTRRSLAVSLAHPWMMPFARAFFDAISSHRGLLSAILGEGERCQGHCGAVQRTAAYR